MRKHLLFYMSILFMACTNEVNEVVISTPLPNDNHLLTETEAIKTLDAFISSMPQTRTPATIEVISCQKKKASDYANDNKATTRWGTSNVDIDAVPVYEIETSSEEGHGFGLVLGDKRFSEVIAFTPKGALADTTFNKGLATFMATIPMIIYESLIAEENFKEALLTTRSDYWQPENIGAYITEDTPSKTVHFSSYDAAKAVYPDYYGTWDEFDTPSRYVPVKWHQNAPYNNKTPIAPCTGTNYKVGCGAVAIAQIMAYHQYPPQYNWAPITASQQISPSQTTAANAVSQLLIDVARAANTRFQCKNDGSGDTAGATYVTDYSPAFSSLGYTAHWLLSGAGYVSSQLVREGLINCGPVLMAASNHTLNGVPGNGGHAWVVDAFYKKSRNYYLTTYGYTSTGEYAYVDIYRQHFIALHCNWGWGGSSDGWYYSFMPVNEKYKFSNFSLWSVKPNR